MTADTPLDLDAIQARADAATPGPWEAHGNGIHNDRGQCVALTHFDDKAQRDADAAFIAAARSDVPALVAEVRRLREAIREFAEMWLYDGDADAPRPGYYELLAAAALGGQ